MEGCLDRINTDAHNLMDLPGNRHTSPPHQRCLPMWSGLVYEKTITHKPCPGEFPMESREEDLLDGMSTTTRKLTASQQSTDQNLLVRRRSRHRRRHKSSQVNLARDPSRDSSSPSPEREIPRELYKQSLLMSHRDVKFSDFELKDLKKKLSPEVFERLFPNNLTIAVPVGKVPTLTLASQRGQLRASVYVR